MADLQQAVALSGDLLIALMKQSFQEKGIFELTVTGFSMSPVLKPMRDQVLLEPVDENNIRKREVLLFCRRDGSLVLHRLIRCLPDGQLRMNGDGQVWTEDIHREQVLAVVRNMKRNGRLIDCHSFGYRLVIWLWMKTRPFRAYMLAVKRIVLRQKRQGG